MSPSCSSCSTREPALCACSMPSSSGVSVTASSVIRASLGFRLGGRARPAGLLALLARLLLRLLPLLGPAVHLRLLDDGFDDHAVLLRLEPVALLLGLLRRGAGSRVVPD